MECKDCGNLAVKNIFEAEQSCNIVQLKNTTKNNRYQNSMFTSLGKRKARPCDPIRKKEDIEKIRLYLLNEKGNKVEWQRKRNHALFVTGISIGLRGSDLLSFNVEDVVTRINDDTLSVKSHVCVYEKKTGKMNYPVLNEFCRTAIEDYLQSRFEHDGVLEMKSPLFPTFNGERMKLDTLYKKLRYVCSRLNLPYHIGTHSLRKTFAYWQIKLNPNDGNILIMLQDMMNHESSATTLRYIGITQEEKKKLYMDMDRMFLHQIVKNEEDLELDLDFCED